MSLKFSKNGLGWNSRVKVGNYIKNRFSQITLECVNNIRVGLGG